MTRSLGLMLCLAMPALAQPAPTAATACSSFKPSDMIGLTASDGSTFAGLQIIRPTRIMVGGPATLVWGCEVYAEMLTPAGRLFYQHGIVRQDRAGTPALRYDSFTE